MHMDSSDLVLDEEGALETKVNVGRERTPFSVSPTLSLLLSLPFYSVAHRAGI